MNIRTSQHISVENSAGSDHKIYARLDVSEKDYILHATPYPYSCYIVEWKYLPKESWDREHFEREIIVLPYKSPLAWLDDLVQSREQEGCLLNGLIKLKDIVLPAYQVPEDYRKFTCGDGPAPDWYEY